MPKLIIAIVKFLARAQNMICANFSDVDYRITDCAQHTNRKEKSVIRAVNEKRISVSSLILQGKLIFLSVLIELWRRNTESLSAVYHMCCSYVIRIEITICVFFSHTGITMAIILFAYRLISYILLCCVIKT